MTELKDNKRLWGVGEVLALSWPASMSMLNSTLMRFIDALMVSLLGPTAMGAQFIAGITSFVPESFATGVVTVVNTFVSQNLGAKRFDRCGQYAWSGIYLSLAFCLLILPAVFIAQPLFQALNSSQLQEKQAMVQKCEQSLDAATPDTSSQRQQALRQARTDLNGVYELRDLEIVYFRYMIVAVLFTLTARPLEQFFYGTGRPLVVLASSLISQISNLGLGWTLIFGKDGLSRLGGMSWTAPIAGWLDSARVAGPVRHFWSSHITFGGLGLRGAAIAALCSWGMHLSILFLVFLTFKASKACGSRLAGSVRFSQIKDLLRIGWPAGVQFLNDVLPWTIFSGAIIGIFGPVNIEASTAAMRWMPLSFMPAVGIGIATTALVGRYIAQGRPDLSRRRAYAALTVAMLYMGCCGVAFLVFRYRMIDLFVTALPSGEMTAAEAHAKAAEIIRIGGYVMICAAVFQLFDAVGIIFIGALRGAGDTFWPMIYTITLSWGLNVFAAWGVAVMFPQWGSVGPWASASLYVIILGVLVAWRFEGGAWKKIDLLHRHVETPIPSPLIPAADKMTTPPHDL